MAKLKVIAALGFLLVIFFSYGIISSHERKLTEAKKELPMARDLDNTGSNVSYRNMSNYDAISNNAAADHSVVMDSGEDFRPTTPGRSPGSGHSKGNNIAEP